MSKLQFNDSKLILICAFRYALSRQTYVASSVVEEIEKLWPELDNHTKTLIQKEIRHYKDVPGFSAIDRYEWEKVLNLKCY